MSDIANSEFALHLREMAASARWIVLAALVAGVAVFGLRVSRPQLYEATAVVRVSLTESSADDGAVTEFQARSLATLVTSDKLVRAAAKSSGIQGELREVRAALDVEPGDTPGSLSLSARADSAQRAADLANAAADALATEAAKDTSARSLGVTTTLIEAADADNATPAVTFGRSAGEGIGAALLVAILLGEGIVGVRLLRGRFSPVGPAAELRELIGAPVLDIRATGGTDDMLPFFLQHLRNRPVLTVIDTTERPSAAVACRLAKVAGDTRHRVLLVDGDTGQPILDAALGQAVNAGTVDVIQGLQPLQSVLRPAGGSTRALLLPVGAPRPGALSGLQLLDAMRDLLNGAGADQVVVSATRSSSLDELLQVTWAFPAAVVLVVDPANTTARQFRKLLDRLHRVDATIVAAVVPPTPKRLTEKTRARRAVKGRRR